MKKKYDSGVYPVHSGSCTLGLTFSSNRATLEFKEELLEGVEVGRLIAKELRYTEVLNR